MRSNDHTAPGSPTSDRAENGVLMRRDGPVVVSYAQNAEDVRLWRVLASKEHGFYVDVGAGDPVEDSVTKLFYDRGWSGINIEPGPKYGLLAASRSRDINLELAISAVPVETEMWMSSPDPGLSSLYPPPRELLPDGFTVKRRIIPTALLGDVLAEHTQGRNIDFMTIDVEGAERDVLSSFDLRSIRPTILVVEAVAPLDNRQTHDQWEYLLVDAGYLFATFDGINRFYVPIEQAELIPILAYPTSVLDHYESHIVVRQRAHLAQMKREHDHLAREAEAKEMSRSEAAGQDASWSLIAEMESTLSWRITRPLRSVRRLQLKIARGTPTRIPAGIRIDSSALEAAFAERLRQAADVLSPAMTGVQEQREPLLLRPALTQFEEALAKSPESPAAAAWVALVAIDGSYPLEETADSAARLLRTNGPLALVRLMHERFATSVESGTANTGRLDVVRSAIIVEASHTISTDHHTGIQRVVRETLSRWIAANPQLRLATFDDSRGCLALLSKNESARMRAWRIQMNTSGAPIARRSPEMSSNTLVPWKCRLVIPEIPHPRRAHALRGVVSSQVHHSLSLICFDLIPIVGAETMSIGMSDMFCEYLSLVKRADRASAISQGTADAFRGFASMLGAEDLRGPDIQAHPLPTEVPDLDDADIDAARITLGLRGLPLVLVVGSHEPRKNHLAVLEAAERIWKSGARFELLMIGGSEWRFDEFRRYTRRLEDASRPLNVRMRATETELWAAYRLARFTVFPSLSEGFGLPVAESLASGTPVITSRHGSMAEIGGGGGALLVDPRSIDELESAMRQLLEDNDLLGRFRKEAMARDMGSWDDYARDVWQFFVDDPE